MKGVLKYLTFTAALAAGLLLSGCTVEDSGGKMVAVPFTLEVSGVVVDVAGHKPVGGYNYRPYNMELNIYSGSPGYNSDSSTYTISDLVVNLERQ